MGGSWQTRKASADLSIFSMGLIEQGNARIKISPMGSSISQWRTFILVNPARCGVHALSFPILFVLVPPFQNNGQDYTVKTNTNRLAGVSFF